MYNVLQIYGALYHVDSTTHSSVAVKSYDSLHGRLGPCIVYHIDTHVLFYVQSIAVSKQFRSRCDAERIVIASGSPLFVSLLELYRDDTLKFFTTIIFVANFRYAGSRYEAE